jgi:hypothetical protein
MNAFESIKQLSRELYTVEKEKDLLEYRNKVLRKKIIKLAKKIKQLELENKKN